MEHGHWPLLSWGAALSEARISPEGTGDQARARRDSARAKDLGTLKKDHT